MAHPLELIHPRNLKTLAEHVQHLLETHLWAKIMLGMLLGVATGVALGPSTGWVAPDTAGLVASWLALPGHLFLLLIQMVVIPLVLSSVIRGIAASGDVRQLRSTGIGLGIYFLVTTVAATAIGIGLAYLVRPGTFVDPELMRPLAGTPGVQTLPSSDLSVPEMLLTVLPQNPLGAMVQGEMLQIVLFALILGVALISLEPQSSKPLLELMGSLQKVSMVIVGFVMRLAPLAVFGLLAEALANTGAGVLVGLGAYALTVVGGLLVLMLVFLGIVAVLGRRSPLRFLSDTREPMLLAFSTDSSAATMPVTIKTAEEKLRVRPSTAQLVVPIGATMNMAGTACYHGLATIFMAQLIGMDLHWTALLALIVTSLGASVGAPATPGVGIMILATVLTAAGVPIEGLALIIGLDQILERLRCVLNVSGDLVACVVLDRLVPAPSSLDDELATQRDHEQLRGQGAGDVLTTT